MTPISTLTILGRSLRSIIRRWPVIATLYGATFLLVLPVVLAFRSTLTVAFATNPTVDQMFSGFDFTTYADFMSSQRPAVEFLQRTVGPFILLTIIVHGLFGAGVVASMAGDGTTAEFLKATGRFLSRSIRLIFYALTVSLIVLLVWSFGVAAVWQAMTSGETIESDQLTAVVVIVVLVAIPVAIISLATEYGRVLIVREDRRQVLMSLFEGFRFVFTHPVRMVLQHGLIVLTLIVLVGLYWWLEGQIGMTTTGGVLIMLVIQQLSVLARVGVRVWHTAAALTLVDAVTPEVPVVSVPPRLSPPPALVPPSIPEAVVPAANKPVAPQRPVRRAIRKRPVPIARKRTGRTVRRSRSK